MPDPGRARQDKYRITLPAEHAGYPPLPWTSNGATMINVYFEVRKEVLLDYLPAEYNRTSPAYCRLAIIDNPDSPAGPYRDAFLALGCRLSMMPAAFVAVSITNSLKTLAAGVFERGYPSAMGKIDFEADVSRAHALISDDKGPLIEVILPTLQTIEPSRLAYDHVDAIRTLADGKTELAITQSEITIERAAISKDTRIEYPVDRDNPWQTINCRNVVSAQVVRGARTFGAANRLG